MISRIDFLYNFPREKSFPLPNPSPGVPRGGGGGPPPVQCTPQLSQKYRSIAEDSNKSDISTEMSFFTAEMSFFTAEILFFTIEM